MNPTAYGCWGPCTVVKILFTRTVQSIVCFTREFWEVVSQVGRCDFLLQQVCFVEEEDEGGFLEEWAGGDLLEQGFALPHSILLRES